MRNHSLVKLIGAAVLLQPQQLPRIPLAPSDAQLSEGFTRITSARELTDGR